MSQPDYSWAEYLDYMEGGGSDVLTLPAAKPAAKSLEKKKEQPIWGALVAIGVTLVAIWLSERNFPPFTVSGKHPIEPVMLAIVLGMILSNCWALPKVLQPGFKFSVKKLLPLGIVLLGARLNFQDLVKVGFEGLMLSVLETVVALLLFMLLTKLLRLPHKLGTLLGVGTAICGVPLDGHVYQYDRENQRANEIRADSSTVAYSYDNIGQLKIADSSVAAEDRGYTYDTAWNLNYRTNNGSLSTFIVDNKNQLTNSFAARNFYDSNGNMVTNNNNRNVLVYDDENQLTRYFHCLNGLNELNTGDTRTDFIYDGLGRLRKRIEWVVSCNPQGSPQGGGAQPNSGGGGGNGCTWGEVSETCYVYDGRRVIQERDSNNVPTVSYTRGNDLTVSLEGAGGIGGLLARSSGYSSGNWTSHADYYSDANGNITSLIDGNQSVVASYRYDPFGNIISKSGTLANANVYRFSSKEVHVNSGMYYYGFRFYDPNLQRWTNRDPLEEGAGINLYALVGSDPVNWVDPLGLMENICKATRDALSKFFGSGSQESSLLKDVPKEELEKAARNAANAAKRQAGNPKWAKFAAQQAARARALQKVIASRASIFAGLGVAVFFFEYNAYGDELPPPAQPGDPDYPLTNPNDPICSSPLP